MTRFEFDNKITVGNLITIVVAMLAIIGAWYSLKHETESNAKRLDNTEIVLKQLPIEYVRKDVFNATENRLQRIEQKLDRLIERGN